VVEDRRTEPVDRRQAPAARTLLDASQHVDVRRAPRAGTRALRVRGRNHHSRRDDSLSPAHIGWHRARRSPCSREGGPREIALRARVLLISRRCGFCVVAARA
jgi:hypothetical protein